MKKNEQNRERRLHVLGLSECSHCQRLEQFLEDYEKPLQRRGMNPQMAWIDDKRSPEEQEKLEQEFLALGWDGMSFPFIHLGKYDVSFQDGKKVMEETVGIPIRGFMRKELRRELGLTPITVHMVRRKTIEAIQRTSQTALRVLRRPLHRAS